MSQTSEEVESLSSRVGVEPVRTQVVTDCKQLVDEEVRAKSGVSGLAIKGAYGTVKKIKPGFVEGAIDGLLDDWLLKLEPFYVKWRAAPGGSFSEFVTARSDEVAEALLSVTDERAETTDHRTAKKLYVKMRPSAKTNVIGAVPKLGKIIERHL